MNLIRNGALASHNWDFAPIDQNFEPDSKQVLTEEQLLGLEPYQIEQSNPGVVIQPDTDLEGLLPYLEHLGLIAIEFPQYSDGRGFSLAYRLRHSHGFKGEIWARGNLISDQYVQALHCGMDAVLIDDQLLKRQPIEHWARALKQSPLPYRFEQQFQPNTEAEKKTLTLEPQ